MNKKNDVNFIAKYNGQRKFGLRKLSIGLTTVILGTTFFAFSNSAQAAETNSTCQVAQASTTDSAKKILVNSKEASATKAVESKSNESQEKLFSENQAKDSTPTSKSTSEIKSKKSTPYSVNIGPDETQYLMANNDNGHIQVDFKGDQDSHLFKQGDSFSISVNNQDNFLKFSTNLPTFDGSLSNFKTSQDNDTFTFTYQGNTPFNLQNGSVTLNFLGNNDAVLKYNKDHNITNPKQFVNIDRQVSVSFPDQETVSKEIHIGLYPYANVVDRKEMVNGYPWQAKVVFTPADPNGFVENNVTYTGPEEAAKQDIPAQDQKDARLMQYVINWNYGRGFDKTIVDPLDDVIANLKFSDGQKILPHTIRVFQITDPSLIGALNENTQEIDRRALDSETYTKITTSGHEDTNFEKFLQDSINTDQSQISINQTGPFKVAGQDYSTKGAYFIQLDTLLDLKDNLNHWSQPGEGPSISYPIKNGYDIHGSGDNIHTQTFLGFNTASGIGSEVKENIHVYYVDDDENKKILDQDNLLDGVPNTSSNYSTTNKIHFFENQNYELVSDTTDGKILIFDDDNEPNNQNYYVHFKHGHDKETISKTVTETIHYYYNNNNGHHTNNKVFKDYNAHVTFKQVQDKDLVTGKLTSSNWAPAEQYIFDKVKSQAKKGYIFDKALINKQKVSPYSKDLEFFVYYSPEHKKTQETKTVNETVHYYYKGTSNKVFKDFIATPITFIRTKDVNLATGEISYSNWTPKNNSFDIVKSPIKDGYTFDKEKIDAQKVDPSSKDLIFIVYYSLNPSDPAPIPDHHTPQPKPNNKPQQPDQPAYQPSDTADKQSSKENKISSANAVLTKKKVDTFIIKNNENAVTYPKVLATHIDYHKVITKNKLPQTSNDKIASELIALAGFLISSLGLLVINSTKRKSH
ncbi:mucin-binding protein [uncultured Lactobacillus sp.]|uniref:mucin-binding protein n=1 Tax=uncultured Lactobacillus sp. TaxID=153152 RepID=UPI002633BB8A|nr:YSIRK-type signal peptide-containing protein [uncultured Lactobacillus sp.]